MKSWGGELNLDIKIDENLLLSDDELLPKNEQIESENLNYENKKDLATDLATDLADLSERMKDM